MKEMCGICGMKEHQYYRMNDQTPNNENARFVKTCYDCDTKYPSARHLAEAYNRGELSVTNLSMEACGVIDRYNEAHRDNQPQDGKENPNMTLETSRNYQLPAPLNFIVEQGQNEIRRVVIEALYEKKLPFSEVQALAEKIGAAVVALLPKEETPKK